MLDPRKLKTLLGYICDDFRGRFQEIDLEFDGLKLRVKLSQEQEQHQAKPVAGKKPEVREVRPALESLAEKPPLFDWGLKS